VVKGCGLQKGEKDRMKKRYYIAYGSNLNINQMAYRCPTAKIVGTSEIPDYRLLFKGSGTGSYLTIERYRGKSVPVAVWDVTKEDERELDRYEGFPVFYYKAEMQLPVKSSKTGRVTQKNVFVYIMDESRSCGMPTKTYMRTCLEGYRDFGFYTGTLLDALEDTMEEI